MSNSLLHQRLRTSLLTPVALLPPAAHAGGYGEGVSGDLSNSGLTPRNFNFSVSAVPEPTGVALMGLGPLSPAGLKALRRRG